MLTVLALSIFILAVYGLSNGATVLKARVITRAVLGHIPVFGGVAHCPACFAFWAAALTSYFLFSPSEAVIADPIARAVVDGLVGSGSTWLLHTLQERLTHGVPEPSDQCPAPSKP